MDFTPDFSRVATTPTDEQWERVLDENPDAAGPYLDSLEEKGDPNLDLHRYFLNLKAAVGGSQSEVIGDQDDFYVSMNFYVDKVILTEFDGHHNENNQAWVYLRDGQIVVQDGRRSNMPDPISQHPLFRNVTPDTLPNALKSWFKERVKQYLDDFNHSKTL